MSSNLKSVKDVMNKSIISVEKNDPIRLAIKKMVRGDIGSLLVTFEGKPTGIITERDILKSFVGEKLDPENKVETIMSSPLISVDSSTSLTEAADIMLTNNIRRLIVKENEECVGIISQRELQRYIIESR
ncbi:MAG: cyclic nucleotide-binding/CBS domain-containing protein [Nitrososphaeraceae archaeon]